MAQEVYSVFATSGPRIGHLTGGRGSFAFSAVNPPHPVALSPSLAPLPPDSG